MGREASVERIAVTADSEVSQVMCKLQKLHALKEARDRVQQLERELYGAPPRPKGTREVPEFLRLQPALSDGWRDARAGFRPTRKDPPRHLPPSSRESAP